MDKIEKKDQFTNKLFDKSTLRPLPTIEEINQLLKQRNVGGKAREIAVRTICEMNARLVADVALLHQGQGVTMAALIDAGNKGLRLAAEKYDETRGQKFICYAVWWIRQSILLAINDKENDSETSKPQ